MNSRIASLDLRSPMMRYLACAIALMAASAPALPQNARSHSSDCHPSVGWESLAEASRGGVAIFGELHGTQESPAVVLEFACAVSNEPVLLAVELNSALNRQLQTAWRDERSPQAFESSVAPLFEGLSDGRGSQAMIAMLSRAFAMKQAGAHIDVVAFNGLRDAAQQAKYSDLQGQGPLEAAQAENIAIAADERDYAHVVVLAGSFHAQKTMIRMGGAEFEPMARRLARQKHVVSLKMTDAGGSAWVCQSKPVADHGARADPECRGFEIDPDTDGGGPPGIRLDNSQGEKYDGAYNVGLIRASPPVLIRSPKTPPF